MEYKAVSAIQLQKITQAIQAKYDLRKPTYTVNLPGGGVQVMLHDEESIQDVNTSDIEKEQWTNYFEQQQKMQSEINEATSAYMFYKGIECEIDNEWLEMQQWLGIALPENKFDVKVMYITTELLKTPEDIKLAIVEIMKLSLKGVDKSAIEAAEGTFLSPLETA